VASIAVPPSITTLGEAVRYLREARGLSLRELAERVGVSAPFLSDVERNRRATDRLEGLAQALQVSVDVLRRLDSRIPSDVRNWIVTNPGMNSLLKDLKESGLTVDELRATFRKRRT
jgi:transcriptional regulator with XRE-family HTH domain